MRWKDRTRSKNVERRPALSDQHVRAIQILSNKGPRVAAPRIPPARGSSGSRKKKTGWLTGGGF